MSRPESAPYSYVRATRELVISSDSLENFLTQAQDTGKSAFGSHSYWVEEPMTLDRKSLPLRMEVLRPVETPNLIIFASGSLRATLFERRAHASQGVNQLFSKVHSRMVAEYISGGRPGHTQTGKKLPSRRPNPLADDLRTIQRDMTGRKRNDLRVVSRAVVDSTSSGYVTKGTEYSLALGANSAFGRVLTAQAAVINAEVRKTVVGRPLFKDEFETEGNILHIPFAHVPHGDHVAHRLFLESLNKHCYVDLTLGEPQWDLKIRSAIAEETL